MNDAHGLKPKRLVPGQMPDPARAHGAWVYLIVSVLAGALSVGGRGFLPALLSGIGFAGVFLAASSLALMGKPTFLRRCLIGILLATLAPCLALQLGADPTFFVLGLVAIFPAALSGYFAERHGFLSPAALAFAVTALVVAAPSAACAGGASIQRGLLLLAFLAPFFAWRTYVLRRSMVGPGWTRARLRRRGLQESAYALGWTVLSIGVMHAVG